MEKVLDDHVQNHQEKESLLEQVINGQVKQLKSLVNSLTKRNEAYGDDQDECYKSEDTVSITSESLNPCYRSRVQSDTWSQEAKSSEEKDQVTIHEEECDSEESFKTASEHF